MSTLTESIHAKNAPGDKVRPNTLGGSSDNEELIRKLYAVAEKLGVLGNLGAALTK